jgi:hypothetical protein
VGVFECALAVFGAVGGGLASRAHECLLQCLGAVIAQRGIAALAHCVPRPWHLVSLVTLVQAFRTLWTESVFKIDRVRASFGEEENARGERFGLGLGSGFRV